MALTKPKAYQLFDIDYKQSVKVVTINNVVLTGGAPKIIDGVTVGIKDRILVTGQIEPSENGLYVVQTAGIGSSGTWIRSQDALAQGQLLGGTLITVNEGTINKDTQWLLTTNDPIIIGTTPLSFIKFKGDNFGFINANGTVLEATHAGDMLNVIAADNINITGDPVTKTITIGATYAIQNIIENGNSNINISTPNGNIEFVINSIDVASVTANGMIPALDNVYALGNSTNQWKELWVGNNTIYINQQSLSVNSSNQLSYNGNIVLTVDSSNLLDVSDIEAAGSITANGFIGDGSQLTNINAANITNAYGNSNVADYLTSYTGNISANVIVANRMQSSIFAGDAGQLSNIRYNNVVGAYTNSNVANYLPSFTGNISANNIFASVITATQYTGNGSLLTGLYTNSNVAAYLPIYSGNINAGNITVVNSISAATFVGNGSQLTGGYSNSNVANYLPTYIGNLTGSKLSVTGNISGNNANITNTIAANNITIQNTVISNAVTTNALSSNNIVVANVVTSNLFVGNGSQLTGMYSNSNVANYLPTYTGAMTFGNLTVGNNITASTVSNTAVITRTLSNPSLSSITPPAATVDQYNILALATNAIINAPSGTPYDGQKLILRIKDSGTPQNLIWSAIYNPISGTLPTTTIPNQIYYIWCIYNSNNLLWDVVLITP